MTTFIIFLIAFIIGVVISPVLIKMFNLKNKQEIGQSSALSQTLLDKEQKINANVDSLMNIYAKNKDFDSAKSDLKSILALNYKNRENILIKYAQLCILNKDTQEGIFCLENELKNNPNNETLKLALCGVYETNGDFEKASELLYDLFLNAKNEIDKEKYEKKLGVMYSDWGVYCFQNEDFSTALEKFMLSLKYDTSNADTYFNLGKLNYRIKDFEQSLEMYKKAVQLNPTDAEIYLNIGYVYEETQELDFAKKCYEKSIVLNDNYNARIALAILLAMEEKYLSAIDELKMAIELCPDGEEAHYNIALAYENIYNQEEALIHYKKVLEINPNHSDAKNNLNIILNN